MISHEIQFQEHICLCLNLIVMATMLLCVCAAIQAGLYLATGLHVSTNESARRHAVQGGARLLGIPGDGHWRGGGAARGPRYGARL